MLVELQVGYATETQWCSKPVAANLLSPYKFTMQGIVLNPVANKVQ